MKPVQVGLRKPPAEIITNMSIYLLPTTWITTFIVIIHAVLIKHYALRSYWSMLLQALLTLHLVQTSGYLWVPQYLICCNRSFAKPQIWLLLYQVSKSGRVEFIRCTSVKSSWIRRVIEMANVTHMLTNLFWLKVIIFRQTKQILPSVSKFM
jgi:hypothetical protein